MHTPTHVPEKKIHPTKIITSRDLPLACPTQEMPLWSQHPRVFLPIERTGEATCPYCSTHYRLDTTHHPE